MTIFQVRPLHLYQVAVVIGVEQLQMKEEFGLVNTATKEDTLSIFVGCFILNLRTRRDLDRIHYPLLNQPSMLSPLNHTEAQLKDLEVNINRKDMKHPSVQHHQGVIHLQRINTIKL